MQTHRKPSRASALSILFAVGVLSLAGCGGERVVSVSGVVTHNGEPMAGLVVSFVPVAQTQTGVSTGTTDDDGRYSLTVATTGASGAVVGQHKVWFSLPRQPPGAEKNSDSDADKEARQKQRKQKGKAAPAKSNTDIEAILKKYGRLDTTPLAVEVTGGSPIDFKLD